MSDMNQQPAVIHLLKTNRAAAGEKPAALVTHCDLEFPTVAYDESQLTWDAMATTCPTCVQKGLDRGQKQARSMRLNKARKEAEAKAAREVKEREEAAANAENRYNHLRRVRLLPNTFAERTANRGALSRVEQDIEDAVYEQVRRLRSKFFDLNRACATVAERMMKVVAASNDPDADTFSGMDLRNTRALYDIRFAPDTGELAKQQEWLAESTLAVSQLAWAAGYIVSDLNSEETMREWRRANQIVILVKGEGKAHYAITDDAAPLAQNVFDDEQSMWLEVQRRLEAAKLGKDWQVEPAVLGEAK